MLCVVVAGGGWCLVLVKSQQGEKGKECLGMTQQNGGRLRGLLCGPDNSSSQTQLVPSN